ncbi:extracellular dioxygenase-like protein [Pholiota conissans]|uniref:Extracellular dioxygenase-like protein n=1 Tax=Pholiota conissans TaxID=109636 RepID=A0A9P6CXP3_9AGAR|nr:extracellular dioxygenase-like protein [Pholiota conissans]
MLLLSPFLFLILSTILPNIVAHPEKQEDVRSPQDIQARREFLHGAGDTLSRCRSALNGRSISEKAIKRRAQWARALRAKDGILVDKLSLGRRDFGTVLNTDHEQHRSGLGSHPSDEELFGGRIDCVLQPEVTVGPYWVKGEMVRNDIAEDQPGTPLYMELQIIDTTNCQPLSGAFVDVWQANATGVYSGVVSRSNGNRYDLANKERTYNRGIQKTDSDGVVAFKSIFPGHYTGRTHHVHLITTIDAGKTSSGTLSGGHISHVGQVFFDQDLTDTVEQDYPYTTNTQPRTPNRDDRIMQEESETMDPVFKYVWLGKKATDGVLAWITIGIDPRAVYHPRAAATVGGGSK